MDDYSTIVNELRATYKSRRTLPYEFRVEQLKKFEKLLRENEEALCQAIYGDVHRCKVEAICYEVELPLADIATALDKLKKWMAPKIVSRTVANVLDTTKIHKDPLGVVLIIGAWNYPIDLILHPMVGALAAGNVVLLKPSEVSPNSAKLLEELIPKYFDKDVVRVVNGGVTETTELLKQKFDHIFYTGSPAVGKIIMAAASKHLTPVTLELGGKCPVVVDGQCDMVTATRRIAWGKFLNCGQTCVAPDYVLCTSDVKDEFVNNMRQRAKEFYGNNPQESQDYARIVNQRHFDRLVKVLEKTNGTLALGGLETVDRDDRYIPPTLLDDVKPSDSIMEEEIFGPILPIMTIENVDEAINYINEHEKPLACYAFGDNKKNIKRLVTETSSGGFVSNDVIVHLTVDTLPFGGVGNSGMGRYHGKFGFDTFTHEKATVLRGLSGDKLMWMRYPPFTDLKFKSLRKIINTRIRIPGSGKWISCLMLLLFGALIGYFFSYLVR